MNNPMIFMSEPIRTPDGQIDHIKTAIERMKADNAAFTDAGKKGVKVIEIKRDQTLDELARLFDDANKSAKRWKFLFFVALAIALGLFFLK